MGGEDPVLYLLGQKRDARVRAVRRRTDDGRAGILAAPPRDRLGPLGFWDLVFKARGTYTTEYETSCALYGRDQATGGPLSA